MGQAAKYELGPLADLCGREVFANCIKPAVQARVNRMNRRCSVLSRRQGGDFHLWIADQNFNELERRVAGGPENGNFDHVDSCRSTFLLWLSSLAPYSPTSPPLARFAQRRDVCNTSFLLLAAKFKCG